jgi:hypothetical protein
MKTGGYNVAVGDYALQTADGAQSNTAVGAYALTSLTTGYSNFGLGYYSLGAAKTSQSCIAIGGAALRNYTGTGGMIAIGNTSGYTATTSAYSIFIGYQAGYYETGSYTLMIDYAQRTNEADERIKAIIYGVMASAPASQQFTHNSVVNINPQFTAAGIGAALTIDAQGSGANGDGGSILLNGKSSTTAAQAMGLDQWLWVDATHATRKARRVFNVYDTAVREAIRIEASGAAPMIGFYGGAAVVRGAALTAQLTTITHTAPGTPDYAIQDFVDVSLGAGWAFKDHDEANSLLAVVANLQTRVAELEARLSSATGVNLFA